MKPFDLEAALRGEKVVTRDGKKVFDLRTSTYVKDEYCISGVVDSEFHTWRKDGKFGEYEGWLDLFMAPKTIKRWVNFYENDIAGSYESEDDAKKGAAPKVAIAIAVLVEFEEGYGK